MKKLIRTVFNLRHRIVNRGRPLVGCPQVGLVRHYGTSAEVLFVRRNNVDALYAFLPRFRRETHAELVR